MKSKLTFTAIIAAILIILSLVIANGGGNLADKTTTGGSESVKSRGEAQLESRTKRAITTTGGVIHSIPLDEIRQGCRGGYDCIPSVEDPEFISISDARKILEDGDIGIGTVIRGDERFYPFRMLTTHELVNDKVQNDPILVSYCPLCGTGIVFDRKVAGQAVDFGVSGLLWQSNLLMYNRGSDEPSLWSQVLGEAVRGPLTGTKLEIIPSDVVLFSEWATAHPASKVLTTGSVRDPYNGNYYSVARSFEPNFDASSSPLPPMEYVVGIEIDNQFKAYQVDSILTGTTNDVFAGRNLELEKDTIGTIRISDATTGEIQRSITGFWFSWVAAHPDTELYK